MRIYIMGICGTAMAHVALLLREMGHDISGSDSTFFPPISTLLEQSNIQIFSGYDAVRLEKLNPDLVIVGNVISRLNPEIEYILKTRRYPISSFPEFLHQHLLSKRYTITVAGTHGKTTTTSLISFLLRQNAINAGYLIGGLPKNFVHGASLGSDAAPFVIEGDEYDTAFFDKKSKFHHYFPTLLVLNNIEFDHGDIFSSLRDIQRTFYLLTRLIPNNGHIVYNGDDKNIKKLLPCPWTQTVPVGFGRKNRWQIRNFNDSQCESYFDLYCDGQPWQKNIRYTLKGEFNARNVAMAAVACHLYANAHPELSLSLEPLLHFKGVERRQAFLWDTKVLKVVEDFAHHPTAVCGTLKSLRNLYPEYKIIACFEPACNTSASQYFERRATEAFQGADQVWFAPAKAHLFSDKFVSPLRPINLGNVVKKLSSNGRLIKAFSSHEDLWMHLKDFKWLDSKPTLLCFLSNGPLSKITRNFVTLLKEAKSK